MFRPNCAPVFLADFAGSDAFAKTLIEAAGERADPAKVSQFSGAVRAFLGATLDEVRLHHAQNLADQILALNAAEDVTVFRTGVLRRELGRTTTFPKQRDHVAHTVNSYLCGWLFFERSKLFRSAFDAAVAKRPIGGASSSRGAFRNVWLAASLLHDIGYMFEGSIEPGSYEYQLEHAANGVQHLNEYFGTNIWHHAGLLSWDERNAVLAYHSQHFPEGWLLGRETSIAPGGLGQLAGRLAAAGPFPALSKRLTKPLSSDAFTMWIDHFDKYDGPKMKQVVSATRAAYFRYANRGLPGLGLRIIDHGVASGLMQLLADTAYYELLALLEKAKDDVNAPRILIEASKRIWKEHGSRFNFEVAFAWNAWGSAAAAVHNVLQQRDKDEKLREDLPQKLSLDDDPLTFLGVLVDTLQDWDRYTVTRQGAFTGENLPVQGTEVAIDIDPTTSRVILTFPGAAAKNVRKGLDACLLGWEALVAVNS
jgi:hypothetical protein